MVVDFDPVILSLGPVQLRWYGLMYVIAFIVGGQIVKYLAKEKFLKVPVEKAESLVTYMFFGMFLGARTFYVFIYNWDYYKNNFGEAAMIWKGGLSFHGACFGMALACIVFAKNFKIPVLSVMDTVAVASIQGVFFGRFGNFINGELYGRQTDVAWGMIFRHGGPFTRHPSQIYQALAEGLTVFLIVWFVRKKAQFYGLVSSVFLMSYGVARYFMEFFREPDAQLGYYFGGTTTMGQILCLVMIVSGIAMYFYSKKQNLRVQ